jgi:hypothetical protein
VKCMEAIHAKITNRESMILCAFSVLGLVFIKVLLQTYYYWYLSAPRWTDRELGELLPMEFLIGRLLFVYTVLHAVLE